MHPRVGRRGTGRGTGCPALRRSLSAWPPSACDRPLHCPNDSDGHPNIVPAQRFPNDRVLSHHFGDEFPSLFAKLIQYAEARYVLLGSCLDDSLGSMNRVVVNPTVHLLLPREIRRLSGDVRHLVLVRVECADTPKMPSSLAQQQKQVLFESPALVNAGRVHQPSLLLHGAPGSDRMRRRAHETQHTTQERPWLRTTIASRTVPGNSATLGAEASPAKVTVRMRRPISTGYLAGPILWTESRSDRCPSHSSIVCHLPAAVLEPTPPLPPPVRRSVMGLTESATLQSHSRNPNSANSGTWKA